jgi:hypothetical protein
MNKTISNNTRQLLKDNLSKCTEPQQHLFKRMYSTDTTLPIDTIVDNMPDDKLDWALTQVEKTIEKNNSKL